MDFNTRRWYLRGLTQVVRETGEAILQRRGTVLFDTRTYEGHEESNLDIVARRSFLSSFETHLPGFRGVLKFELEPFERTPLGDKGEGDLLTGLIDEVDGTTNAKRALSSPFESPLQAAVCAAISTSERLGDLQVGVTLALDCNQVWAGIRTEGQAFLLIVDDRIVHPEDIRESRGDSKSRLVVADYSTDMYGRIADIKQALFDAGLRPYGGCRATGMDIINMLRNGWDGYIDPRAAWEDSIGAKLHSYDVASSLPCVLGAGFDVSNIYGEDWQDYTFDDTMHIMINRPDIHGEVVKVVSHVVKSQIPRRRARKSKEVKARG